MMSSMEEVKKGVPLDSDLGPIYLLSEIEPCMDSQSSWERHQSAISNSILR